MFLRKIPNQSVRRRAIRHWPLLLLRIAGVRAASPWRSRGRSGPARPRRPRPGGGREVVILLDRSPAWATAATGRARRRAAKRAVQATRPGRPRRRWCSSRSEVEVGVRADVGARGARRRQSTGPRPAQAPPGTGRRCARPRACSNRPRLPRREIVLVSDFQKSGWDRAQDATLPPGVSLTTGARRRGRRPPMPPSSALAFARQEAARGRARDRVARASSIARRTALQNREVVARGRRPPRGHAAVSVGPERRRQPSPSRRSRCRPARARHGAARTPTRCPSTMRSTRSSTAGGRVPVLIVESGEPGAGRQPVSGARARRRQRRRASRRDRAGGPRDAGADWRRVGRVLNDTRPPSGAAGRALDARVRAGMGLLVALGERSSWPADAPDLLPGKPGAPVDRSGTTGGALGFVDYGHPVFEVFAAPRSGDLTAARMFRYRPLRARAGRDRPRAVRRRRARRWWSGVWTPARCWRGPRRSTVTGTTSR